eukprot:4042064-Pleurochrysis_carterae.AAC.2
MRTARQPRRCAALVSLSAAYFICVRLLRPKKHQELVLKGGMPRLIEGIIQTDVALNPGEHGCKLAAVAIQKQLLRLGSDVLENVGFLAFAYAA